MRSIVKLLTGLAAAAVLSGCVVVPYGRPHAYVGVVAPAPVVVVHGYYGGYWHR